MKYTIYNSGPALPKHSEGLALIELMIAMLLGLILIGAATGVMLSNTQSFRFTKDLSQTQDSVRLGFELMARDIRQAGSIPCGNDVAIDNLLTNSSPWYLNWSAGQLRGYTGDTTVAGLTNRADGTQVLTMLYIDSGSASLESGGINEYEFETKNSHLKTNDIALICNERKATFFKTEISAGSDDNTLAKPLQAGNKNTQTGTFEQNAVISQLKSRAWYIGTNEQGARSLYMIELTGAELGAPIEIATGVQDIAFTYRLSDTADFKPANDISNWSLVNAVQISLTPELYSRDLAENAAAQTLSSIVALRNRIL